MLSRIYISFWSTAVAYTLPCCHHLPISWCSVL
uniref:Uncharacterized protein n=1 Tax=Musa acuminata subsp. malaccensis TaxID=214687 RepID=A0A804JD80_MUSAM